MTDQTWLQLYGKAATTALGFFWKAGWAFVLGYSVSAMIQAFVPKARLTRYMGEADAGSVALATGFGAASSSCSFAALATARSLLAKGAHFIAAVAFMFASTNLVIELGVLIVIFLGWQYLAAEVVGGLVLIVISSLLIRLTYPARWIAAARDKVERESDEEEDFDWRARIASRKGWRLAGHHFVGEWRMVWEEILIGFTVAGFVAVLVPAGFWKAVFLADRAGELPGWLIALENALVGPLVAAMTFIGSMGNIPLATVLAGSGVLFAGVMAFIYSDLVVPPLVRVNATYYGWPLALYVSAVMYASIVLTSLVLQGGFAALGLVPGAPRREIAEITRFAVDYTFWLNIVAVLVAVVMLWLWRSHVRRDMDGAGGSGHADGLAPKRVIAYAAALILLLGLIATLAA